MGFFYSRSFRDGSWSDDGGWSDNGPWSDDKSGAGVSANISGKIPVLAENNLEIRQPCFIFFVFMFEMLLMKRSILAVI